MLDVCDMVPEWPEIYAQTAETIFDFKRDVDTTLELWKKYRSIAPDERRGYTEAVNLLLLREQSTDAIKILEQAQSQVKEVLERADIDGCRTQLLIRQGQTNEAVRVAAEVSQVNSYDALQNYADILFKSGQHAEALKIVEKQTERYNRDCVEARFLGLSEAASYRKKIYQRVQSGALDETVCWRLFDALDKEGLLGEFSSNFISKACHTWFNVSYLSAIFRNEQKWEEATKSLDEGEKKYTSNNAGSIRLLMRIERERVEAKKTSLNPLKEEGFLTEGQ